MAIHLLGGRRCCILSGIDQSGRVVVRTDHAHVIRIPVAALTADGGYPEIRNAAGLAPQPPRPMIGRPAGLRPIADVTSRL